MLRPQLQDQLKRQFFSQDHIAPARARRDMVLGVLQVEGGRLFLTDGIISIATAGDIDCQVLYSEILGSLAPYERLRGAVCLFKNAKLVLSDGDGFSVPKVDEYLMSRRKSRNFKVSYEKEGYTTGQQSQKAALFLNLAKEGVAGKSMIRSGEVCNQSFDGISTETPSKEIIDISTSDSVRNSNRSSKRGRRIQKKKQTQNLKKRGQLSTQAENDPDQNHSNGTQRKRKVRASTLRRREKMLQLQKMNQTKKGGKKIIKDLRAGEFDCVRNTNDQQFPIKRKINFELVFEEFHLISPYAKKFFENDTVMLADCLTEEKESLVIRNQKLDKHIRKMRDGNDRSCGSVLDIGDLLGDVMFGVKIDGKFLIFSFRQN